MKSDGGGHFMPHDSRRNLVTLASVITRRSHRVNPLLGILWILGFGAACAGNQFATLPANNGPLQTRWAAEVSATNALPEYPRPQLVRSAWLNLNGEWDYCVTATGSATPTNFTGKILVPFPIESILSGVQRNLEETNTLWYRRQISIPEAWRGQRVRLHFGAVDWEARVWVNGSAVGRHRGGFDAFSFDITDYLHGNGAAEILVGVTDPTEGDQPRGKQSRKQEGIFYTPTSGIWQTVWLEPVPHVCVERLQFGPDIDAKLLRLRVATSDFTESLRVEAVAAIGSNEVGRVLGRPNSELELPLADLRLWSPGDPFLYDLVVTLKDGNKVVDTVRSYFGMRKVAVRKDEQGYTRIALNDQFLFQIGTLDQGFWPDGIYTAPTDEALRSDIEFSKRSGFNLIRKHVKVEPARWYYWCDRLGLLVWQDMPSGNNATVDGRRNFETELLRMVEGLENHPCLITWVLFNEGWGQYDTERLTQWLKALDPSRLVNNASGWTDMRVGELVDIHSYPGPDCPVPESRRAAVLGEFGGLGLPVENHCWSSRCWGYLMLEDAKELGGRYTRALKQVWALHHLRGLSAAVYTQTTDVETECNGLLTYDRAVAKIDPVELLAANRGEFSTVPMKIIVPDAMLGGRSRWKYTLEDPGTNWFMPEFDFSNWEEGVAGFGSVGTPGSYPNTIWRTADIWMRRDFVLNAAELAGLRLRVYHDEEATIYINGVLALSVPGYATDYDEFAIADAATATLRAGSNSIAVHCHQSQGGQGIDVGIVAIQATPTSEPREAK